MTKETCDQLEERRTSTFTSQDKILERFRKLNKPKFDNFSQVSLEGHLLGSFGKVEGVKKSPSMKRRYLKIKKQRSNIVNRMIKNRCL